MKRIESRVVDTVTNVTIGIALGVMLADDDPEWGFGWPAYWAMALIGCIYALTVAFLVGAAMARRRSDGER